MLRILFTLFSILFIVGPATAKDKPILTVYTYSSFVSEWGPGAQIKENFEAKCDCIVNMVSIDDGVMILNRLRLEGNRTKADVILGLDTNLISIAKQAKLVQSHDIVKPTNLAVDWWDEQFIPYDYSYFAFIYNQEKISSPPTNFAELLDNPDWKIVYQDPRTSTPGLGLLLWINKIYGENAPLAWKKLAQHTVTVTKGWSESYGLFLKGEADFVLSYSTSPVVHINDGDHRYKAAIFSDGNYEQIEVAAITQYAKQPDLAKQFLMFLLTPQSQQILMNKNIMYPAISIDLPVAYQEINPVTKALSFSADDVARYQKIWIKQWQDAVSQ